MCAIPVASVDISHEDVEPDHAVVKPDHADVKPDHEVVKICSRGREAWFTRT